MAVQEEEIKQGLNVQEKFKNLDTFFSGGKEGLRKILAEKLPQIVNEKGNFVDKDEFLNICYFAEEGNQLVVGYYCYAYGKEDYAEPKQPEIITQTISWERVHADFADDPEKIKAALIIPVMWDLDWTLGKIHSFYETQKLKKLGIDLLQLEVNFSIATDKASLVKDLVEQHIKNKPLLLNLAEEVAIVLAGLKSKPNFLMALVTNCQQYVWLDFLLGLLMTTGDLKNYKNWQEVFGTFQYGYENKATFILKALQKLLLQPGILGYRLICLIDDDETNYKLGQKLGLKYWFKAERDKPDFLYDLCNFFGEDEILALLKDKKTASSENFAMQISSPPQRKSVETNQQSTEEVEEEQSPSFGFS